MSWGLAKGDDFLPKLSLEELREMHAAEVSAKEKLRLLIAIKRKEGASFDAIAEQLEMKRITVNKILHRFQERGIAAKTDEKRSGRPRKLTQKQMKSLRKALISGPRKGTNVLWTTRMIMDLVRREYGPVYSTRHVRRVLHQLGFSIQKPRPRHYKTDIAKQAHFKKTSGKPSENTENVDSRSFFWTNAPSR
jgi:transposase